MRVLAASGVFAQSSDSGGYRLTPVSTLLLSDNGGGCRSLKQMVRLELSPFCVSPAANLAEWFATDDETTPFAKTFGTDHWDFCGRDPGFSAFFNDAMACDSRFVMDAAARTGGAAKAVATAFLHIECTVLDLPHVIHGIPADGQVEFVAGNMMDFIPQADALLLKVPN
nr:unnamed protein product [Digitaria exilis]